MSKPAEIKPIALFLIGWLAAFGIIFPHGVVVCIGEPAHVELGILDSVCCDEDSHLAAALAGVSAALPDNTCTDCTHILATNWHHYSKRQLGESFGWNVNVQSQPVCLPAPILESLDKNVPSALLALSVPIPPLLLERLSTSILIC